MADLRALLVEDEGPELSGARVSRGQRARRLTAARFVSQTRRCRTRPRSATATRRAVTTPQPLLLRRSRRRARCQVGKRTPRPATAELRRRREQAGRCRHPPARTAPAAGVASSALAMPCGKGWRLRSARRCGALAPADAPAGACADAHACVSQVRDAAARIAEQLKEKKARRSCAASAAPSSDVPSTPPGAPHPKAVRWLRRGIGGRGAAGDACERGSPGAARLGAPL